MPPMMMSPEDIGRCAKAIGPEHCVLSTDFGQVFNPPATEGFHMMLSNLFRFGKISEEDLSMMVKDNPVKILGLA
jgi:microsomal dipeptidase-like Zn-dependent dipeptidase